jgi:hypothetical protein
MLLVPKLYLNHSSVYITLARLTPGFYWVFFVAFLVRRFLLSLPLPVASRAVLAHRWWRLCGSPAPRSCDGWL